MAQFFKVSSYATKDCKIAGLSTGQAHTWFVGSNPSICWGRCWGTCWRQPQLMFLLYHCLSPSFSPSLFLPPPHSKKTRLKNKIKKQDPIIHIYWDCQMSMIQKWKIEIFTHVSLKSKGNKIKTSTQTMLVILGNSLCFSKSQFPHF